MDGCQISNANCKANTQIYIYTNVSIYLYVCPSLSPCVCVHNFRKHIYVASLCSHLVRLVLALKWLSFCLLSAAALFAAPAAAAAPSSSPSSSPLLLLIHFNSVDVGAALSSFAPIQCVPHGGKVVSVINASCIP